jgi:FAD/FMN-containing dehydrogenase
MHTAWVDRGEPPRGPLPASRQVGDASRLDETNVDRIVFVSGSRAQAEQIVAAALADAKSRGLAVSVAGAKHAMGGHAIAHGGVVLEMSGVKDASFDAATETITCGAGARWHDLIDLLDPLGRAIEVMQSNDSFSVGGSLSVNCHGWQPNRPPIASTVVSLRMVLADGSAVFLKPGDALFSLALGGYGLFGVIVEATLGVVKNAGYIASQFLTTSEHYVETFRREAMGSNAGMAFGRFSVDPETFLADASLTVYRTDPATAATMPTSLPRVGAREPSKIARWLFRGEVGSAYGKHLRWVLERRFGSEGGTRATRNQLQREPVELFQNRRVEMTDILHEYFVPPEAFADLISDIRRILREHPVDLLNLTVRNLQADRDTFLAYARQDVFSVVLLFAQYRTPEAELQMAQATRALVDAALARGGCYYLPYRLHPTGEQLRRAYPQFDEFVAKKRAYDPGLLLQNRFWQTYS